MIAGAWMQFFILALRAKLPIQALKDTIFICPTFSEIVKKSTTRYLRARQTAVPCVRLPERCPEFGDSLGFVALQTLVERHPVMVAIIQPSHPKRHQPAAYPSITTSEISNAQNDLACFDDDSLVRERMR